MRLWILILLPLGLISCNESNTRFVKKSSNQTGIDFQNNLTYTEDFNPYTYRNFFNGGGVALGDINNDGLIDIYFTGNIVDNALYLNKGNWEFENITESAGVLCRDNWSTGATFVDINNDGFLLDKFIKCKNKIENHFKCFINVNCINNYKFINPHYISNIKYTNVFNKTYKSNNTVELFNNLYNDVLNCINPF